jgi:hypothetical protein
MPNTTPWSIKGRGTSAPSATLTPTAASWQWLTCTWTWTSRKICGRRWGWRTPRLLILLLWLLLLWVHMLRRSRTHQRGRRGDRCFGGWYTWCRGSGCMV